MDGRMIPSKGAYLFAHFMLIGIIITPNTSEFRMEGGEPGGHTLPISDSLYCKIILLLSINDITHSSICK